MSDLESDFTAVLVAFGLLPFKALLTIIQFYTFGGIGLRKFEKTSLIKCLKMLVYRTGLGLGPFNAKYINLLSNRFLLNNVVGTLYSSVTATIPGYGKQFDAESIWLVKQPKIKPDDPILIYLHGGGFFLQTQPAQIESILAIYKLLHPKVQSKTSILLLDYKLVSDGHSIPTQLNQLDSLFSKLQNEGYTNFTFIGDSAGGNMAVSYLDILKQRQKLEPSTKVVFPTNLVLISPWVKLDINARDLELGRSFNDNHNYDIIQHQTIGKIEYLHRIIGTSDIYSLQVSPGSKKPFNLKDWQDIPTLNDPNCNVFVICGEDESFRDDILEWSKYALNVPFYETVKYGNSHKYFQRQDYEYISENNSAKTGKANVRLYVEPWGVHDECLFFENTLFSVIKKNPELKIEDVDDYEYFGIARIVRFLNDKL